MDTLGLLRRPTVTIGEYRPISRSGKVLKRPSGRSEEYADVLAWLRAQTTGRIRELVGYSETSSMARQVKQGKRSPSDAVLARLIDRCADEIAASRAVADSQ